VWQSPDLKRENSSQELDCARCCPDKFRKGPFPAKGSVPSEARLCCGAQDHCAAPQPRYWEGVVLVPERHS
jgi:hypothetical protein